MGARTPLSTEEIERAVADLEGWSVVEGKLHTECKFGNFADAFAFMTEVASAAEEMDHHPEWCNVYNRVVIDLVTHDAGGRISAMDVELARKINALRTQDHRDTVVG
jgi:4a-hydroxytetrahydrobiopterin dehydratase